MLHKTNEILFNKGKEMIAFVSDMNFLDSVFILSSLSDGIFKINSEYIFTAILS